MVGQVFWDIIFFGCSKKTRPGRVAVEFRCGMDYRSKQDKNEENIDFFVSCHLTNVLR